MSKKSVNFIKDILYIKDYWLSLNKSKEETINGFIFSLLVMFDGDAGLNDFHSITLTDDVTSDIINDEYPLHELFCIVSKEKNQEEK